MKVLIVLHNLDLGGIQKKSIDIMRYLVCGQRRNAEVVLGIMIKGGFFYDRIPTRVKVVDLYRNRINLFKLVLDYKPEVIWAPTLAITTLIIKLILFWLPMRVAVSQETVFSEYLGSRPFSWLHKFLARVLLPTATKIIAVNETIRQDLIMNFGVPQQSVVVVRNWMEKPDGFRTKSKNSTSLADLIFVGRLAPEKNLDTIINIAKIIVREFPDLKVKIIGDGPDKSRLKRKISQDDLGKNVVIKNPIRNIFQELSRSKIFILTSRREGCPLSLLEAMAAGTAAAVPDISVMRELAEQGAGVILCSGPDEYAAAVTNLLKNEKLRLRLGNMSKTAVGKYYRVENRRLLKDQILTVA